MPVIFNMKAVPWPSSSNKHGDGDEEGDVGGGGKAYEIAYMYEVPNKGTVYVTSPFIDKISITFPVIEDDRQAMIKETMEDVGYTP